MNRKLALGTCACLVGAAISAQAAESLKTQFRHPLRILVPNSPGGGQDTTARLLGSKMSELVGQQVIVENRPGGGGVIAAEATLKAPPDGHTMYIAATSFVVMPSLRKALPFDTLKDFAPIMRVSASPGTLVVNASLPVRNVRDLVKLAKSRPGEITFGSAGLASNSHLSGELFKVLAGVDMIHVPFKGSALATASLVAGEIVVGFSNAIATLPHVRSGRLRLLAVTPAKRSALLPDVPTIAEAGVPGFENVIWSGIVVNSATPAGAQSALHQAISRAIDSPEVKEQLARQGSEPFTGDTPAAYASFIKAEIEKWGKVVRQAGLKL